MLAHMRLTLHALALSLSLLLVPRAHAQQAPAATPPGQDASAQCRAAFAQVGAGQFAEALRLADAAIASIPRPLNARSQRTLGACYYNRGRAQEGLAHPREAVADYLRSLRVRANNTVSARIQSLVPTALPSFLPTALAILDAGENAPDFRPEVLTVTSSDGVVWHFLGAGMGFDLRAYAFAEQGEETTYAIVDSFSEQQDGDALGAVANARAFAADGVAGATFTTELAGLEVCDDEGACDVSHRALVIVSLRAGAIVSRSFTTEEFSCGHRTENRVRLRGANVVLQRAAEDLAAGEHPIASVLRVPVPAEPSY